MSRSTAPWVRRLVIALVVLIVVLVVLDRGGDYVAERIAADKMQSSQHLDSRPDVSIDGVPFLTQFARRSYDHITVDADDLPIARDALQVSHLHVDLNHLTASRDFATFHVDSLTARATVTYADLSRRLGVSVRYSGDGRISATKTLDLPVVGRISPSISVRPALVDGALTFAGSAINGAGDDLDAASAVLSRIFAVSIPFDGLPFEIKVRSLTAGAEGLQARFVGADLTVRKGQ